MSEQTILFLINALCTSVIVLRSKMVLGKNNEGTLGFLLASAFLPVSAAVLAIQFYHDGNASNTLTAIILLGGQAIIFFRQEKKLPALKKKRAEQQAESERRAAEWRRQQDEAKKTKEKLITKWLDKEGRNDDSPKAEQQAESERPAVEWQQQDEAKKKYKGGW